jgi:hypothetical protein
MDMTQLTQFFGWMLLVNVGIYCLAAGMIIFARDWTVALEARITGVPAEKWSGIFMDHLSRYKVAILVFNFAPWVALVVMG